MKLLPEARNAPRGLLQSHAVSVGDHYVSLIAMSGKMKIEKWLLADWSTSRRMQEVIKVSEDMKVVVTPNKDDKTIVTELPTDNVTEQIGQAGDNGSGSMVVKSAVLEDENGQDYSPSASSWAPTDKTSSSEDSDNVKVKSKSLKIEDLFRRYSRQRSSKKVVVPVHRPNAVVNVLRERQTNNNRSLNSSRKRKYKEVMVRNKSLPDSTKKNSSPPKEVKAKTVNINVKEIVDIKTKFEELLKLLSDLKPGSESKSDGLIVKDLSPQEKNNIPTYGSDKSGCNQSEDLNRSDDNVLITNKYSKALGLPEGKEKGSPSNEDEWIPIGSGKTLIHKDKYRRVNWKSYTIATRTLLLATFTRRILATHSLTGKRSPAFQNKPAKMCLDPKIVSDILMEITSKFKVKENLVRSIITTKCADECKMYKSRTKNKRIKDQENLPPATHK